MATELASAYVQIIPSAKGMKGAITQQLGGEATSAGTAAGASFGSNLVGKLKTVIAAAGIGKVLSDAINEGANLQQSIGGIETLFKDSADTVKKYADEAYRTAGMSANEYMETVTGFSASLLQGLGGDTAAAADIANTALIDMSDNANKMGTDMESIKNAYQGFAKQNYTMLDNLKLGYGGTKSEMERLLADAQKISGVKYDISNLSDVYEAIHVIQGELDITGTTAKEASSTLSGSMASMKAAFTNVLGNLALGEDIGPALEALGETVFTFLTDNLFPMVGNIISAAPELLSGAMSMMIRGLNIAANNADEIVQMGIDVITELVTGLLESTPYIIEAAINLAVALGSALLNTDWIGIATDMISTIRDNLDLASGEILGTDGNIIASLATAITTHLPELMERAYEIVTNIASAIMQYIPVIYQEGVEIVSSIVSSISENLPAIYSKGMEIMTSIMSSITEHLPDVLNKGIEIITNLVTGLLQSLPEVIAAMGEILVELVGFLLDNLPTILEAGVKLIFSLAQGILQNLPEVLSAIGKVLVKLLAKIAENLPKLLESGYKLIGQLAAGLIKAIPKVISATINTIKSIVSEFGNYDWLSIGSNIISGIINGLKAGISAIVDAAKEVAKAALDAAKSALGIASPSKVMRDEVGKWIPEGVAVGIKANMDAVPEALDDLKNQTTGKLQSELMAEITTGQNRISRSEYVADNKDTTERLQQTAELIINIYDMLSEYLPQLANMQLVTDTGILAGELAPAMDVQLGNITGKRNRGR